MYNDNTKMASRFGLDIEVYDYNAAGTISGSPVAIINFANEVNIELTSDITWATGGKTHGNMIPFKDPTQGTLKISTQVVNTTVMKLLAGNTIGGTTGKFEFKNDAEDDGAKYYIIKGKTVWKGEDGDIYGETVTAYKACVKPNYSVTYNGSGDPQSLDIEFELGTNDNGQVIDFVRADRHTLTYNLNGGAGTIPSPKSYNDNEEVSVYFDNIPTKQGYTFAGWATTAGATSATYTSSETSKITMTADTILYAVFVS